MAKGQAFTNEDDALLAELGVEAEARAAAHHNPQQERIIAGFEDIQRFVAEQGRAPQHGEGRDIFERLYAVRLDHIRQQAEYRMLVKPLDHQGLLSKPLHGVEAETDVLDDDAILAELDIDAEPTSITQLQHVRSSAERQAAEEIARRNSCKDFHAFKPHFEQVQKELDTGLRDAHPFKENKGSTEINVGDFFIVGGQKAYVASKGRQSLTKDGKKDARLRVIFDNGTESKMLMRSLQRSLYKDHRSRRITQAIQGPLFANYTEEGDGASGTIYVLRSHSQLPDVVRNRDLIHKIGVTSGKVEQRIRNPQLDPTFLMAEVEIVATYKLYNINSKKLESLIHRIFQPAQLTIEVKDRFGNAVVPREWFLVPRHVIDQAVEKIQDGAITGYTYDPRESCLKLLG
ncbi:MAG: hypothetical protein TH68_05755 [Candidatus Synechococcus spongiarum 142]|uniref:Bacteriophage T5 Orf172 DNA-binding domain-containing protein n=1 Tax=Candidatus Synechococcus spongiarum 142 TaxID=1608213 RepID=A0A6N3X4B8_9SYNE|nr:MAG: hypothetical protein TH68_05755 [Candidatus Synechococcus spongiarum 142]